MKLSFSEWLECKCPADIAENSSIYILLPEDIILDEYFSRIELRDKFYELFVESLASAENTLLFNQVVRNILAIFARNLFPYSEENMGAITFSFSEEETRGFDDMQKLIFAMTPQAKIYNDRLLESLTKYLSNPSEIPTPPIKKTAMPPADALSTGLGISMHVKKESVSKKQLTGFGSGFKRGFLN